MKTDASYTSCDLQNQERFFLSSFLRYLPVIWVGLLLTKPVLAQRDTKAKEVLDNSLTMLNHSGGLSISFSFNMNDEIHHIKQSFEGQILLKGAKFFLDTPEQTVYFDGKTQWVYDKPIEEVSILEPQPQDIQTLNPIAIFELYKLDCDYKYQGEKTDIQKRKVHEITLFPQDKKADIERVDVQINPTDWMPVFFHILYKNKAEYRIHINKYQTKQNFSDSQFVFDKKKYPQVEVNDLR